MINPEQELPVALFTSYIELPSRVPYKPDESSRLQVLAAAELLGRKRVQAVVFAGGDIPSESNPEPDVYGGLGSRMAAQLRRDMPNLPESAIVLRPVARSTRGEIAEFKKLAQEREWANLMVVSKKSHLERVQRAVNRFFGRRSRAIPVKSNEDILSKYPRYASIIDKLKKSRGEQAFAKRERLINAIDRIPLIGGALLDLINTDDVKILATRVHRILSGKPKEPKRKG